MRGLIKIKNPNKNLSQKSEPSIGIDFGTTYCLACLCHNDKISFANNKPNLQSSGKQDDYIYIDQLSKSCKTKTRPNSEDEIFSAASNLQDLNLELFAQERLIPSVVAFCENGSVLFGEEASLVEGNPKYKVIRSAKKLIEAIELEGDSKEANLPEGWFLSASGVPSVNVFDREVSCVDILSLIMENLLNLTQRSFPNVGLKSAVITTPAYFGERSRNVVKKIAQGFGVNVKRIINEPTAAAICYGLHKLKNKKSYRYLVFDLGGGTFDVSVLRFQQGVFQVLATRGDVFLGGDNFDERLAGIIKDKTGIANASELNIIAREAKIKLSQSSKFTKKLSNSKNLVLTRKEYEEAISDLVERTIDITRQALLDSELQETDVDGIVLIGGATNTPIIKKKLAQSFTCKILDNINPSLTVATGAAMQAAALDGRLDDLAIIDVTPLSLGIEMFGGTVERIIPRNTPIPISNSIITTTFQPNQTAIELNIVQGERDLAQHCSKIGSLTVSDIEPGPAGSAIIEITFSVDIDGLLTVEAKNLQTGSIQQILMNPVYDLDRLKIESLIKNGAK